MKINLRLVKKFTSEENSSRGKILGEAVLAPAKVFLKIGLRRTLRGKHRRRLFFSVLPPDIALEVDDE